MCCVPYGGKCSTSILRLNFSNAIRQSMLERESDTAYSSLACHHPHFKGGLKYGYESQFSEIQVLLL